MVGFALQHLGPFQEPHHIQDSFVYDFFGHFAGFRKFLKLPARPVSASGHFQIGASQHGFFRGVKRAPVGHHEAFKTPFVSQDIVQEPTIGASLSAVEQVVAPHHSLNIRLFDGHLKRSEIQLSQGTLIHDAVGNEAIGLLFVGREMLDARSYSLSLHSPNEGHSHAAAEIGVFAVALKSAPRCRHSVEVHGRSQQHLNLSVLGF